MRVTRIKGAEAPQLFLPQNLIAQSATKRTRLTASRNARRLPTKV